MPIFEYVCKDCKKRFEALVYGAEQAHCPLCKGTSLDQQISVFSVGSTKPARSCAAAAGCGGNCEMVSAGAGGCCPLD
jgi:putative FmdB family regulatory protein